MVNCYILHISTYICNNIFITSSVSFFWTLKKHFFSQKIVTLSKYTFCKSRLAKRTFSMLLQQGKINNCSNKEFTFLKLFSWTTKHHPCRIRHFPFKKHLSRKKEQFTYLHALLLPSLVIKRLSLLFYLVKSGVTVKVLIIYDNIKTFFFYFPCSL